MNFHPTSFFILENVELGTFWISQTKMRLGTNGQSLLASITINQLIDKLVAKYVNYDLPCIDVVSINKNGFVPFYGLERWLSKLDYKIKQSPKKYEELDKLLKAGWHRSDTISHSKINVLQAQNPTDLQKLYKRLILDWEAKGLRCLNALRCKTDKEKYEDKKKDPDFMYNKARKEVLRQIKKTGKMPKDTTVEKYQIKEEELKECMEEEAPCQPCEKDQNKECVDRKGIIYKITSPSGKVYVGQTVRSFEKRMREHKRDSSCCTLIKRAIDKYGNEMVYEIIEEDVPQEHLDDREIYWIKELNSLAPDGYNLNTGGRFYEATQEVKDNVQMAKIKSKIEKDGYMGDVRKNTGQNINMFYPRIRRRNKHIPLSTGGFRTEEEAIEVLKQYTEDPENFTIVDNRHINSIGSVYPTNNGLAWMVECKRGNYLGTYKTKEEAQETLERYLRDPENFTREHRKVGYVKPRGNKWKVVCKCKYLGTYETEEEGYKAVNEYLKDPEKFTKPQKAIGSIFKSGEKWRFKYKGKHIGYYATQDEAEEARKALAQSSTYTSSSEMA